MSLLVQYKHALSMKSSANASPKHPGPFFVHIWHTSLLAGPAPGRSAHVPLHLSHLLFFGTFLKTEVSIGEEACRGSQDVVKMLHDSFMHAGDDNNQDAFLGYEVLMHLLHTQSAEQTSLETLYRLRRARQKNARDPGNAGTRLTQQQDATAAAHLDKLCPLEAERLQGESWCVIH